MSQARRTRHFVSRASRKMPRSSRLAHKAPVMQAIVWLGTQVKQLQEPREEGMWPTHPFFRVVRKYSVYAVNFDPV